MRRKGRFFFSSKRKSLVTEARPRGRNHFGFSSLTHFCRPLSSDASENGFSHERLNNNQAGTEARATTTKQNGWFGLGMGLARLGRLPTWFSEQQLSHGLRAARRVLRHALVESLVRLHQAQNLEVAAVLCRRRDGAGQYQPPNTMYTTPQCRHEHRCVLCCAVVTCVLIPCVYSGQRLWNISTTAVAAVVNVTPDH